MIDLSQKALDKLNELGIEKMLRITIMGGGCIGFQYQFSLDTVKHENDIIFDIQNAKVVLDKNFLPLIDGSTIDYKEDLTGSLFVIKNPNAAKSCGCGNSFSL